MNIPDELLPVLEWWEKDGKKTVAVLALAALAAGGWYGWKAWDARVRARAADALLSAYSVEELESAVADYGSTPSGKALRQRLAKSYFDASRYEEAPAIYDGLKAAPVDGFEDVPAVGRAECLEALGRREEAKKEYEAFAEAKPKSIFALTAKIGAARCAAQLGSKDKAVADLEVMLKAEGTNEAVKAILEKAIDVVKRIDVHAPAKAPEKPAATNAAPEKVQTPAGK